MEACPRVTHPAQALSPLASHAPSGVPYGTPAGQVRAGQQHGTSIENGHFVLTMMPSLYCALNCPHCYLSKAERRDTTRLSDAHLDAMMGDVARYYAKRGLGKVSIHAYQYGGEPTSMGLDAFSSMLDILDHHFPVDKGFDLRHTILSALVGVDLDLWAPLVHARCGGYLQSSYDGRMRGGGYMTTWLGQMEKARALGITMGTISVVNRRLLEDGPEATLDTLAGLGVVEASFLPFMENLQNTGKIYDRLAPTMAAWDRFMIALGESWIVRRAKGEHVPEIGQMRFVLAQAQQPRALANIAAQTLFLMPNGDYALPDYKDGWREYMHRFGNGLELGFEGVLTGPARRAYLRRQALRNHNPECQGCPDGTRCVMEFWKPNRAGDSCFGGKGFVSWVMANAHRIEAADAAALMAGTSGKGQRWSPQADLQHWLTGKAPLDVRAGGRLHSASLY